MPNDETMPDGTKKSPQTLCSTMKTNDSDKPATSIGLRVQSLVRLVRRVSFDRLGIEFPWNGDTVIWLWWWRRNGLPKYISVGFSGNGDFGDVRFHTLAEIDAEWGKLTATAIGFSA